MRAGIGGQLGVAAESTWGTPATVGLFLPFTKEGLEVENEYIKTAGIRAGRMVQSESQHVKTTRSVSGPVDLDVLNKGFGRLLNMLHGATVVPAQVAASDAYTQTHPIGASIPEGKGLTVQVGRPDTGGVVRPFTYSGCKVLEVEFKIDKSGVLTSSWSFDGKDVSTAIALAAAVYPTNAVPFNFLQGSVEFDDVLLTECVAGATIKIAIPMKTDRYCLGSTGTKNEQITNDQIAITAELDLEFASLVQHAAYMAATRRKFELNFLGDEIGAGPNFQCDFTAAKTVTTKVNPVIEGPDVLEYTAELDVVDDGSTAPLVIFYESTDTAL